MKLDTQGVLVTGFAEESSAERAGLRKGDVIIEVDGEAVHTVAALQESLEESQVVLTVLRNGKEAEFCVNPQKTEDGSRLGAYVRDSVAGIGTVTYYDPNTGNFGALGHGVNDAETSILMPLEAGVVVRSTVSQVEKGRWESQGNSEASSMWMTFLAKCLANTEQGRLRAADHSRSPARRYRLLPRRKCIRERRRSAAMSATMRSPPIAWRLKKCFPIPAIPGEISCSRSQTRRCLPPRAELSRHERISHPPGRESWWAP